jgi:hypothetical protein
MAVTTNSLRRDFYVYQFKVDGYPFYVGIGRSQRGPDRLRYVRSLLTPRNAAKLAKSSLSVRVMAVLLRRKKEIAYSCTRRPMTRRAALAVERKRIAQLITNGFLLTNWQGNPHRHRDVNTAVRAILVKQMMLISN